MPPALCQKLLSAPPAGSWQHLRSEKSPLKFPGGIINHVYRRYLSHKAFVARQAKPVRCGNSLFVPIPLSLREFLAEPETWNVINSYALMHDDPAELVRLLKTITGFPGTDATFRRHLEALAAERNDSLVIELFQNGLKGPAPQN
jgi:hypothetical protein